MGVEVARDAVWQKQELLSPRVPIVRTWRSAGGLEILEEAFAVPGPPRSEIILVHVRNLGTETRRVPARCIVDTALEFHFRPDEQRVVIGGHETIETIETITSSLKMTAFAEETKTRRAIQLDDLTVPSGETARFFVLASKGASMRIKPATLEQALSCRERAIAYWAEAPLPQGRVQVPDAGIQALLDSSIRNIWQAREIRGGLPVFQVGPTCYRGLWIVDGAFLLEAATILGAGKEARNGIAYTLSLQKPSGAFEVLSPQYTKENGIVLWTCVRHALLTQDKAWLDSAWPKLEAVARDLRKDPHGNAYLPILMANAGNELPQRAQWAFCHAVYPGQIFARGDPLVAGNLAMLEATTPRRS